MNTAESRIEQTEGDARQAWVDYSNKIREELNKNIKEGKETIVKLEEKNKELLKIEVFEFSNDKWGYSFSVNTSEQGSSIPLSYENVANTKKEAIEKALKEAQQEVDKYKGQTQVTKAEIEKIKNSEHYSMIINQITKVLN